MVRKKRVSPAKAAWSYQIHTGSVSNPRASRDAVPLTHPGGRLDERGRERERGWGQDQQ